MIDGICRRITQNLLEKNIIEFEDHEIYMYGLQLFISTIFKGAGIYAIAYGLGWIKEVTVFLIAFGILRTYAGGYHSSTYFKCFILTVVTMLASITMAKYITIHYSYFITLPMLVISALLIFKYAPVDTPNKPLSVAECKIYRRKSIMVIILESLTIISAYILKRDLIIYCNIAAIAILLEALTLTPVISNSILKEKELPKKEV